MKKNHKYARAMLCYVMKYENINCKNIVLVQRMAPNTVVWRENGSVVHEDNADLARKICLLTLTFLENTSTVYMNIINVS